MVYMEWHCNWVVVQVPLVDGRVGGLVLLQPAYGHHKRRQCAPCSVGVCRCSKMRCSKIFRDLCQWKKETTAPVTAGSLRHAAVSCQPKLSPDTGCLCDTQSDVDGTVPTVISHLWPNCALPSDVRYFHPLQCHFVCVISRHKIIMPPSRCITFAPTHSYAH